MKAITVVLVIFLLAVSAQSKGWMASVDYHVAIPGQEMKPQINNPSLLGFSLDARKFISPQFAVGANLGNQVFYCKCHNASSLEDNFFGGSQYYFLNTIPLMLTSQYYFNFAKSFKPYLGLNVGGYYAWQRSEKGLVVMDDRKWHWGFAPGAGVLLPVAGTYMNMGTKISFISDSNLGDPQKQLFMSFYVGFSFADISWR